MRNKILMVVMLVGVFALGVLSVRAWDHYKVTEQVKAHYAQVQQEATIRYQQKQEAERAAAEAAEKTRLHDVCVKNAVKAKTAVSACDIQQVQ